MSVSTTSNSVVSQFGLYRTIDSRTEEFLKLSKKRQIRQGCACAAVTAAITVTIVIVILLLYEYSIVGFLKQNLLRATNPREYEPPMYFQRFREEPSSKTQQPKRTALEYVPELLGALKKDTDTIEIVAATELAITSRDISKDNSEVVFSKPATVEQTSPKVYASAEFQSKTRLNRNFQNMKKIVNNISRSTKNIPKINFYDAPNVAPIAKDKIKPKGSKIKVTTVKPTTSSNKLKVVYPAVSITALMSNIAKLKDKGPISKLNCTCEATFNKKLRKSLPSKKSKLLTTPSINILESMNPLFFVKSLNKSNSKAAKTIETTTPAIETTTPGIETTTPAIGVVVDNSTKHSFTTILDRENISTLKPDTKLIFDIPSNEFQKFKFIQYAVVPPTKKINKSMWAIMKAKFKTTTHRNIWKQFTTETITSSDKPSTVTELHRRNKLEVIKVTSPPIDEYDNIFIIEKKYADYVKPRFVSRKRKSRNKPNQLIVLADKALRSDSIRETDRTTLSSSENSDARDSWSIIDNYDYDNIHQDDFDYC